MTLNFHGFAEPPQTTWRWFTCFGHDQFEDEHWQKGGSWFNLIIFQDHLSPEFGNPGPQKGNGTAADSASELTGL